MTNAPAPTTAPREWRLTSRPIGWPTPENFALVESDVPDLAEGQILVRNEVHLRRPVHARPDERRQVLRRAVRAGRGHARRRGRRGRRVPRRGLRRRRPRPARPRLARVRRARREARPRRRHVGAAPPSAYLGVLGMTGLTAYAGLTRDRRPQGGRRRLRLRRGRRGRQRRRPDRQGAGRQPGHRQRRLRREGQAPRSRSSASTRRSTTRTAGRATQLREAAPDGIDVYFDNVGGDHLEAAIGSLRLGGRIADLRR